MSQYNTDTRFPLTDRPYLERVHHHNNWPPYYDSSSHLTVYHPVNNTWQNNVNSPHTSAHPVDFQQTIIAPHPNAFPSSTDYPESSQRTILTSSPDNIEAGALHPIYDHRRSQSLSHSSDYNHSTLWDANTLTVDKFHYPDLEMHQEDTEEAMLETQPECSESRQTSPVSVVPSLHHLSVKVEPDDPDGCFIMELSSLSPSLPLSVSGINQSLAPPTEVPLRATQASKEMRKMMGVFRLNPFAMHSGEGRGVMPALWCGGGPLEEEPLVFEFQLDIVEDDSGDRQFDHIGILSAASGSPTIELLGTEEEAQLRSFSPSFELHPEDQRSDMGEEHEQEQEDCTDPDQQNEWSDVECGNQSEVDTTSSTTHSVHTPSETRSAHTPFNESSSVYQYPITPSVASSWDIDSYQAHGEEHIPPAEKMEGGHKMHRVHTGTYYPFSFPSFSVFLSKIQINFSFLFFFPASHPYLRRSVVNHQATSPSSSTHSLSQSNPPHLHTTQPQLNFAYSLLQHPTTHHQHQHYNNQVPTQNHSQQSYSQHHPTVHDSTMISAPPLSNLDLIPVSSSHRPETSMYSSSYMRSSGRTLKLAAEDETSSALHHHPAGIVNEYTPRGTASSNILYTSQHDTHHTSGHHHQYEVRLHPQVKISRGLTVCFTIQHSSSSSSGHVLSPSRRWSLPETIGSPFRSTTM